MLTEAKQKTSNRPRKILNLSAKQNRKPCSENASGQIFLSSEIAKQTNANSIFFEQIKQDVKDLEEGLNSEFSAFKNEMDNFSETLTQAIDEITTFFQQIKSKVTKNLEKYFEKTFLFYSNSRESASKMNEQLNKLKNNEFKTTLSKICFSDFKNLLKINNEIF